MGTSANGSIIFGLSETTSSASFHINAGGPNTLWRWTAETGITTLELGSEDQDFLFAAESNRDAVSDDGSVAVLMFGVPNEIDPEFKDGEEVVRWTAEKGAQVLPTKAAYRDYRAAAHAGMSPDGEWLIGWVAGAANAEDDAWRSWLWNEELGVIDLRDLMQSQGLGSAVAEWEYFRARQISADGHVISGEGINPDGISEAWVVFLDPIIVPEPSSLVLGTLALAGVVATLTRAWYQRHSTWMTSPPARVARASSTS